ncbi:MAG: hypothetical protein AAFR71_15520 [Pseudomonadota bacterium]
MKKTAVVASAALLAIALTSPATLADTVKQTPTASVEKSEKFAAPFGSACSVTHAKTDPACNDNNGQETRYPKAPVFPQFGI